MKKNQTLQTEKQPKNIFYRIIMAVMAICVPLTAYFSDLIYIVWDSEAFKMLAQLKGNTQDNGQTEMSLSIRYLVEELLPKLSGGEAEASSKFLTAIEPVRAQLIAVGVFLAIAVVLAVVIFFVSCFSKNKNIGAYLAGAGILATIGMAISFHYLEVHILAGEVALGSFLAEGIMAMLLSSVAQISLFKLTTAFYLILFLFIAMLLWSVANWLVTLGDKKTDGKDKKKA